MPHRNSPRRLQVASDRLMAMSPEPLRTPSDSRCSQPAGAPYRWVHHVDVEHPSVVRFEQHLSMMLPSLSAVVRGEIRDLFEAARLGELEEDTEDFEPLKPIVSDPEVWELRIEEPTAYRFYHGEPARYPNVLVSLHRHVKDDAAGQQEEIDFAISRYYPQGP